MIYSMNVAPSKPKPRRRWKLWLGISLVLLVGGGTVCWWMIIRMPGESFLGELPKLDEAQQKLVADLKSDVNILAVTIGERNTTNRYPQLNAAADYVESQFAAANYKVQRQTFEAVGLKCHNLEVELPGTAAPGEIVVVGAHYDSFPGTPGANDNASGTAAMLALARRFAMKQPQRTLRFVAFTNEEPPHFQRATMGSWHYAARCRQRNENIIAAISLETIGYYSETPGSQAYPPPLSAFYPSEGNFIGVVGNVGSRQLVRQVVASFRRHGHFPSEGGAIPGAMPGIGWSDHWSFWQHGYPGVEITDTAPFRYAHYHRPTDTPDKLNFDHIARVVEGLVGVIEDLAAVQ